LSAAGPGRIAIAVVALIVSNFFFQAGVALNSAFLPELAKPAAYGRISGFGWSIGYLGGLLTLGVCLAYVTSARTRGIAVGEYVPVTMWIVVLFFALAAAPTFIFVRERARPESNTGGPGVWKQFRKCFLLLPSFPDFRRLLYCGLLYQAGIYVVITLAAIYAQEVMKFTPTDNMVLILIVNVTAAAGAFCFGYLQDRIGHRRTLAITLAGWILMILIAASTTSVAAFWLVANVAGLCMGSSQSAGRALVGWLAPEKQRAAFYGLWNAAMGISAIIGPPTYGLVTWLSDNNHRLAILISGIYFVLGLIALFKINLQQGRKLVDKRFEARAGQ
jgi:UMF1 family MFS transporter